MNDERVCSGRSQHARSRQSRRLQGSPRDHHSARGCRVAPPARFFATNSAHSPTTLSPNPRTPRRMPRLRQVSRFVRKPRPLSRAAMELLNAANGFRPLAAGLSHARILLVRLAHLRGSRLLPRRVGARRAAAGIRATSAAAGHHRRCADGRFVARPVAIHRRGVTTPKPVLRAALVDGLGPDYAEVLQTLPQTPSPSHPPHGMAHNDLARRRYVESVNIVHYGPHGRANLADVWRRRDLPRQGKAPVLVQIPGGAWALGWRRPQAYPLMSHLADRGWVIVALNYRVSPRNHWPDHIIDETRPGLGQGEHLRLRRGPEFRCDHR